MPERFRLGINMAGAVSAGAYTAGVFDFLVEALDAWQAAKDRGEPVPMHDVCIEVLSGASAGGMCAAIATAALYDDPARNESKFHKAWVKSIDIRHLISQSDLGSGDLRSLLNSDVLHRIAKDTLQIQAPHIRKFVSRNLNLFLTLTNTRGVPYGVNFANDASFEEHTNYYAEQIQFEVTHGAGKPKSVPERYHLRLDDLSSPAWQTLKTAAIATGAVPVMLAPQILERNAADYTERQWQVSNSEPCKNPGHGEPPSDEGCNCWCEQVVLIPPAWNKPETPFENVYVDGGMTNNNPFECARLFLARQNHALHNERSPSLADAAVITIAPFPGADVFDRQWNAQKHATVVSTLASLKDILVNQSRFTGEALSLYKDPNVASRYVIAPDDDDFPACSGVPALQCGSLAAFGGFLAECFRERDYQLGRRNCQMFLRKWLALPFDNPLIQAGLAQNQPALVAAFQVPHVEGRDQSDHPWMPIIPLCSDAVRTTIPNPGRKQIPIEELDRILDTAASRLTRILRKVSPPGIAAFGTALFGGILAGRILALARPAILNSLIEAKCLPKNAR